MAGRTTEKEIDPIDLGKAVGVAISEGSSFCTKYTERRLKQPKVYTYPRLRVTSCIRETLEPLSKVTGLKIISAREKKIHCKPQDFPPDGKGRYLIDLSLPHYKTLKPHIPQPYRKKWVETWKKKKCYHPDLD